MIYPGSLRILVDLISSVLPRTPVIYAFCFLAGVCLLGLLAFGQRQEPSWKLQVGPGTSRSTAALSAKLPSLESGSGWPGIAWKALSEPAADFNQNISLPQNQFVVYQLFHFIHSSFLKKSKNRLFSDLTCLSTSLLCFLHQTRWKQSSVTSALQ